LFGQAGEPCFQNLLVFFDRGYLVPSLVFGFLLLYGAMVLGTLKRMAGWAFTFSQNTTADDPRTVVDTKGAPTLFLKKCSKQGMPDVFASAFRNGTDSVATAISTLHNQFQLEGIATYPAERKIYKHGPSSLVSLFFFERVGAIDLDQNLSESDEEKEVMMKLIENKITPQTLRQRE
jgi:hypothetical protein